MLFYLSPWKKKSSALPCYVSTVSFFLMPVCPKGHCSSQPHTKRCSCVPTLVPSACWSCLLALAHAHRWQQDMGTAGSQQGAPRGVWEGNVMHRRLLCCSWIKRCTDVRLGIELHFVPSVLLSHPECFSGWSVFRSHGGILQPCYVKELWRASCFSCISFPQPTRRCLLRGHSWCPSERGVWWYR